MIKGYMTVKENAEVWSLLSRRIQIMCAEGKIEGAVKLGRERVILGNDSKPMDGREATSRYKN